jgi:hypothetical protein
MMARESVPSGGKKRTRDVRIITRTSKLIDWLRPPAFGSWLQPPGVYLSARTWLLALGFGHLTVGSNRRLLHQQ